jgi:hypothetical protein
MVFPVYLSVSFFVKQVFRMHLDEQLRLCLGIPSAKGDRRINEKRKTAADEDAAGAGDPQFYGMASEKNAKGLDGRNPTHYKSPICSKAPTGRLTGPGAGEHLTTGIGKWI